MSLYKDVSGPVWGFRLVALLASVCLFLQPILIGQYLGHPNRGSWLDAHNFVGHLILLLALVLVVFAFLSRRTFGIGMTFHCAALLVLCMVQLILGFESVPEGTDPGSGDSKAIHIPLGVLLFGMGTYIPFLAFFDLKAQRQPDHVQVRDSR